MKAWRFYDFNDMRLDEVPEPEPGPEDVVLRVRVVQPSVTEAILASGRETVGFARIKQKIDEQAPVQLFGHEYCAEVVEVGANVDRLKPGDRVVDRSLLPCMTCALCKAGRPDECRRGPVTGFDFPGCLAEYAAVPHYAVVPIPDEVSDYAGAAMQPVAECVASVDSAQIECDDVVVVIGQGSMGIYSMQAARHTLAGEVIAVDVRPEPLSMAKEFGADHCIDASEADPVEAVLELTGGKGADVVIESAGGPPKEGLAGSATVDQAFGMVRDCGKIVINSMIPGVTGIDFIRWRMKSINLIFPMMADLRHLRTSALMTAQGRMRVDPLVSHVVWGLEHAPKAFEITAEKARFGATGPCQIVVDTGGVPRHPKVIEEAVPA